ncbi:sensor histidine kinase [Mycolicibacterium brumae]|uniref:Sensor-like histidine kinase SenX3 n=1 Tax=Mycolicibacterium brumae TaxID=85968 RepID=A0A2G5PGS1_9MYCO|nr:ATP-binding protein [Mycolicibacterium brumae]MCV7192494.1 sensor histidine kinase [Mycolicibacterium brumae]PIB77507.1 two-component sensor histidine kinase [Mycolicibacterium brumae]RWA18514.1 hypothetical protein MBRU_04665 [Mycolicibacterium brumae DSM 44177]UWW10262.1 ATP-binding protein [Mycolicibacterium brumae]
MSLLAAVLLAGVTTAAGVAIGLALSPRLAERRRIADAEQAGMTMSELLADIVARAPIGVAVVDKFHDVVYANDRAAELGLVRDRRLDDRVWQAAQRTLADGRDTEVSLLAGRRAAQGRSGLSVRVQLRRLDGADPRFALIYADDQSELARVEATRRDFVANVSHELKTPVGAMGVLAEALLESVDDPETVRRFGTKVLAESRRLAGMVGELIELSRLQGADPLPDLGEVDVDSVVAEAVKRNKVAADNHEIRIVTDAASGLTMLGDHTLLATAVANLISNGIAYSPQRSTVSISRRRRGDLIEIAVTDRGIGIAKDDQERVFERFFRVDQARSRATGGTGLGLAIVKHVAANHNGTIRVWSQLGTGSTFTLAIPAWPETDEQA